MTLTRWRRWIHGGLLAVAASAALGCWRDDPVAPNGATNRIIWSARAHGQFDGQVAATSDLVFAATDSGLMAVERASGRERWYLPIPGLGGSKTLVVRGTNVYSAGVYSVQANDVATGAIVWQRDFDPNVSAPDFSDLAADDGALYVGLRDGRALALALSDGHTIWEAPIATAAWTFKGLVAGSTISGDTIYVTATRYLNANWFEEAAVVVALDRLSGRELWRYQAPGINTAIAAAAVLSGKNLIFTDAYIGALIAIDRGTGIERWRQSTRGFIFGAPVVRGDTVYAVTSESRGYAFAGGSGQRLWTANIDYGATSVGICGNELFVGDFEVEVRTARTGKRVGIALAGTGDEIVTSRVTVLDGVAYVGTNTRLIAFRCH